MIGLDRPAAKLETAAPAPSEKLPAGTSVANPGAAGQSSWRKDSPDLRETEAAAAGSGLLPEVRASGSAAAPVILPGANPEHLPGEQSTPDGWSSLPPKPASGNQPPLLQPALPSQAPAQATAIAAFAPSPASQTGAQEGNRPARAAGAGQAVVSTVHKIAAQAPSAADGSLPQYPAGFESPRHGQSSAPVSATGTGARDTFTALDAEPAPGAPNWIHAGAQHAEAGFEDPALGWVGVRAELSAGGVHAAVVPASAEAAQALGGHMAGLNAHLANEHIPVQSLSMTAEAGRESLGSGQGAMQQDAGEQGREAGQSRTYSAGSQSGAESVSRQEAPPGGSRLIPASPWMGGGVQGTHISVMA